MKCKSLVIGSIAGLALKAAVLLFQVLADKKQKIWCKKNRKNLSIPIGIY
jgi:hypothetical protein